MKEPTEIRTPTEIGVILSEFNEVMKRISERRIVFVNGDEISIQASSTHYCSPADNEGPYTHVELGMPTFIDDELLQWAEDPDNPMNTVYSLVPVSQVIRMVIEKGGIRHGVLLPMKFEEKK